MRERIEVLETYDLQWWIARLRPILDEFIQTTQGHPNREFWQAMYKPTKAYFTEVVTGWIADLFPYLGDPPNRQRSHVFEWHRESWVPAEVESPETADSHLTSGKLARIGVSFSDFFDAHSTLPSRKITLPKTYGAGTGGFPSGLSSVPFELTFPDHSTRNLDLVAEGNEAVGASGVKGRIGDSASMQAVT
jgi:hypothetical protein